MKTQKNNKLDETIMEIIVDLSEKNKSFTLDNVNFLLEESGYINISKVYIKEIINKINSLVV